MNVAHFSWKPYAAPFRVPLRFGSQTHSFRRGFHLFLKDENGNFATGEGAPLPHFSQETYEEVEKSLFNFSLDSFKTLPPSEEAWLSSKQGLSPYPSLNIGLDMAIAELFARRKSAIVPKESNGESKPLVNSLITSLDETLIHRLKQLMGDASLPVNSLPTSEKSSKTEKNPKKVVKIKIARGDLNKEIKALGEIGEHFKPGQLQIRLDANGGLSIEQMNDFCERIESVWPFIDYFEEPLPLKTSLMDLELWYRRFFLPYALDERVLTTPHEMLLKLEGLKALVLKPTLIGSYPLCLEIIDDCLKQGKDTVISSCFESPVGMRFLFQLANRSPKTHHGLDTLSYAHWENFYVD